MLTETVPTISKLNTFVFQESKKITHHSYKKVQENEQEMEIREVLKHDKIS